MAGNEQVFDSIVDPKANAQVQKLTDDLLNLDGVVTDTVQAINQLNQLTANSSTFSGLSKNTAALALAQEKLNNLQQQGLVLQAKRDAILQASADKQAATIAKIQAAEEKAAKQEQDRIAKLQIAQTKASEKIIADSKKKQSQLDKESAAFAAAEEKKNIALAKSNRAFNLLNQRYQDAIKNAKDIGAAQGATSQAFIDATLHANALGKQVDAINTPLGDFKNKVGGYTEGIANYFGKAFGYLRQAAYILPGIGIAGIFNLLGEGFIALAEKTGIFNEKITQSARNQKALNDVNKEADRNAGEQITHLQYLYKAATDVTNSSKDRLLAVNELQKEFPNYFKNIDDETIKNGGAKKSYDELNTSIIENARALAAAGKIAELRGRILDTDIEKAKVLAAEGNEAIKLQQDIKSGKYSLTGTGEQGGSDILADQTAKKSHERAVKAIKDQDDLANGYKATIKVIENVVGGQTKIGNALAGDSDNTPKDKIAKSEKPLYEEYLKALKLREEAILGNEKSSYEERLKAVNDYFNDAYDLTKKYSDKGVLTQIETNNKLTEFDVDTNKSRIKVREDAEKELSKLIKDGLKNQEDAERASIELIQSAGDEKVLTQAQNAADAEQALAEQYAKGLITQREYQTQLTAIEDEADIDRLDKEIVTTQAIIDVRKGLLSFGIGSAKELQSAEDKLANLKLARTKAGTKAVLDGVKDEAQARQQLHDKEKQLADASINLIQSVVDGGYARQLEALQQVSKQVDDNATKEKDAVNSSLLSAKDKADKNAVIDAKTQLQKEQIAIREKEIKRDQAEFDRAIAIARIIEETAVGIVTALTIPIGGIALASVIGALGAVQLATVLATPLPAFKDGGVTGGGHILWGEAGMEKATLPGGSVQYSNGPTIQDFPKGTIITPHLELMKSIKPDAVKYTGGQEVPWREVLSELRKNRPTKQKGRIIINNNTDHNTIRKNYFK